MHVSFATQAERNRDTLVFLRPWARKLQDDHGRQFAVSIPQLRHPLIQQFVYERSVFSAKKIVKCCFSPVKAHCL